MKFWEKKGWFRAPSPVSQSSRMRKTSTEKLRFFFFEKSAKPLVKKGSKREESRWKRNKIHTFPFDPKYPVHILLHVLLIFFDFESDHSFNKTIRNMFIAKIYQYAVYNITHNIPKWTPATFVMSRSWPPPGCHQRNKNVERKLSAYVR